MNVPTLRKPFAQRFPSVVPQQDSAPLPVVGLAFSPQPPREVLLPRQISLKWEWEP